MKTCRTRTPLRQSDWSQINSLWLWSPKGKRADGYVIASAAGVYSVHKTTPGQRSLLLLGLFPSWSRAVQAVRTDQNQDPPNGMRNVAASALGAVLAAVPAGFGFAYGSAWGKRVADIQTKGLRAQRKRIAFRPFARTV